MVRCPPLMGLVVKRMVRIEQSYNNINIQQCTHWSDAFLVHQFLNVFQSYDLTA